MNYIESIPGAVNYFFAGKSEMRPEAPLNPIDNLFIPQTVDAPDKFLEIAVTEHFAADNTPIPLWSNGGIAVKWIDVQDYK